jgi:hypothetical protein
LHKYMQCMPSPATEKTRNHYEYDIGCGILVIAIKSDDLHSEAHKSIQKFPRHLRSPDRKSFMSRRSVPQWSVLVDQVSICIMLNHIPRGVPPVVEYLASEDMSTDAPNRLIALLCKPLMPQSLGVEVMHLEAAVVHVRFTTRGKGGQEHCVMIDKILAPIDVCEHCDVPTGRAVTI